MADRRRTRRSSSDPMGSARRRKRLVSFGFIEFHVFEPDIGDNPSVSGGVPITLSQTATQSSVMDVDVYEQVRRPRRRGRALIIDRRVREELLLDRGFDMKEIAAALREARRLRHQREQSYYAKNWDGFHERLEGTTRKLKKIVSLRRTDKESTITIPSLGSQTMIMNASASMGIEAPPRPGRRRMSKGDAPPQSRERRGSNSQSPERDVKPARRSSLSNFRGSEAADNQESPPSKQKRRTSLSSIWRGDKDSSPKARRAPLSDEPVSIDKALEDGAQPQRRMSPSSILKTSTDGTRRRASLMHVPIASSNDDAPKVDKRRRRASMSSMPHQPPSPPHDKRKRRNSLSAAFSRPSSSISSMVIHCDEAPCDPKASWSKRRHSLSKILTLGSSSSQPAGLPRKSDHSHDDKERRSSMGSSPSDDDTDKTPPKKDRRKRGNSLSSILGKSSPPSQPRRSFMSGYGYDAPFSPVKPERKDSLDESFSSVESSTYASTEAESPSRVDRRLVVSSLLDSPQAAAPPANAPRASLSAAAPAPLLDSPVKEARRSSLDMARQAVAYP